MSTVYNAKLTEPIKLKYNKYMEGVDANDQLLKYFHFSKRTLSGGKKFFPA